VDGTKVDSARELIRVVARKPPGANVTLNVRRQGRDVEIPVTIGKRPATAANSGAEE
jgi:serine protease Do